MEVCSAMHKRWIFGPLRRQKLILASAKAQQIWDFHSHYMPYNKIC